MQSLTISRPAHHSGRSLADPSKTEKWVTGPRPPVQMTSPPRSIPNFPVVRERVQGTSRGRGLRPGSFRAVRACFLSARGPRVAPGLAPTSTCSRPDPDPAAPPQPACSARGGHLGAAGERPLYRAPTRRPSFSAGRQPGMRREEKLPGVGGGKGGSRGGGNLDLGLAWP